MVAGHAERGLVSAGIATAQAWSTADLWLYTFHMPLFMLLAGINIPASLTKGTSAFLRSKLQNVLYPYILWSLVQGSMLVMLSHLTNSHAGWDILLKIGWQPISPFWFLYALFVFMVLVALVRGKTVLIAMATLSLIASGFMEGETLVHQLCYQFSFFLIGVLSSKHIQSMALPRYSSFLFLAAWLACVQVVPPDGGAPYLSLNAFTAALTGIASVLAFSQLSRGWLLEVLACLGRASMSIYVMHVLATAGTRIVATRFHLPASALVLWLICTLAGVLLPFLAWLVLRRLGILHWFGLAGWPKAKPVASLFPEHCPKGSSAR